MQCWVYFAGKVLSQWHDAMGISQQANRDSHFHNNDELNEIIMSMKICSIFHVNRNPNIFQLNCLRCGLNFGRSARTGLSLLYFFHSHRSLNTGISISLHELVRHSALNSYLLYHCANAHRFLIERLEGKIQKKSSFFCMLRFICSWFTRFFSNKIISA